MLTPQRFLVPGALAAGCIGVATAAHAQGTQDEPDRSVPEIVVVESANRTSRNDITPGESAAPVPDAMEVLTRLPGANVNRNGPLSGQAQYRGLFGPRMTVTVNDMRVTPGGPNWMDAPLHYMPAGLTERVTMTRGIAPVSAGPGIGGLIEAEAKGSEFTATADWRVDGNAVVSLMSNEGTAASAVVALANHSHRMHAIASDEEGDAIESATGVIGATSHERATRGLAYGYRWDDGEVGIEYSHTDTGSTGTPSLPLDINLFDTERVNAELHTRLRGADVTLRVFSTDILHAMDNYTLRDAPDFSSLRYRRSRATTGASSMSPPMPWASSPTPRSTRPAAGCRSASTATRRRTRPSCSTRTSHRSSSRTSTTPSRTSSARSPSGTAT